MIIYHASMDTYKEESLIMSTWFPIHDPITLKTQNQPICISYCLICLYELWYCHFWYLNVQILFKNGSTYIHILNKSILIYPMLTKVIMTQSKQSTISEYLLYNIQEWYTIVSNQNWVLNHNISQCFYDWTFSKSMLLLLIYLLSHLIILIDSGLFSW